MHSGHPYLNLVPTLFAVPSMEDLVSPFSFVSFSILIPFYFLFIQGPVGDPKCLSCIAHGAEECHPHPCLPIRPSTTARSRLLGTIDGSLSCVECDKAHASHCSHMKPADVSLFYTESLRAPSFASTQREPSPSSCSFYFSDSGILFLFLDIMSRLRTLASMWSSISYA